MEPYPGRCFSLCQVLERWSRSFTPCFMPLPQPVIKAMARGVRAAPALENETLAQAAVWDAFHEHPGPTVSSKRYATTVNALGLLRASLGMAKEKE